MNRPGAVAMLLVGLLCTACGGKTWHTTTPTTPTTYDRIDAPIERSVGKLRRLALVPVKIDATLELFHGAFSKARTQAAEADRGRAWAWGTEAYLASAKGYEIVRLDDMSEDAAALATLTAWAEDGRADQTPPADTASAIAEMARRLSVDGFVVVRGVERAPRLTPILMILTASLSWPLIAVENRQNYHADVIEAASGRIVWRANLWKASPVLQYVPFGPADLFRDIEHAVPSVLAQ